MTRVVTDALRATLFTTSPEAVTNLRREGIDRRKIHQVGNVMIDALRRFVSRSDGSDIMKRLGIEPPYALLTLHRPSNVDDREALGRIVAALEQIARELPVIFPAHPRTAKMMEAYGVRAGQAHAPGDGARGLRITAPLGYLDFIHLEKRAALVLTDSGGVQEETTILGVPCLTLRENTGRPITLTRGTNRLVGSDTARIVREARRLLVRRPRRPPSISLWDGRAADRIAAVFARFGGPRKR